MRSSSSNACTAKLTMLRLQNFNGNFEAWRWLLMIGVLVPINHTGNLLVKMLVWLVEYVFWFQKKALYYLVGTKVGSAFAGILQSEVASKKENRCCFEC